VPHIDIVNEADAAGKTAEVYQMAADRAGGVANIIKVMSRDGRSLGASMSLYLAIMKSPNALSPARREMLAAVVSNINDCYY